MIAVVVVRDGVVPAGGAEAVGEAGGRAVVVGTGTEAATAELARSAVSIVRLELDGVRPAMVAAAVAPLVGDDVVVLLPGSPDGRDVAPRLAARLDRPLLAGALHATEATVAVVRYGGRVLEEHSVAGPLVATLLPNVRGLDTLAGSPTVQTVTVDAARVEAPDAEVLEVLPPDVATMDLVEAPKIVGGGAGLDSEARFDQLRRVATALDASLGATRVVTDRAWVGHERQIGTTGVVVSPELYVSFGVSGAVQHTAGLGTPEHVISVNVDPHCPMMAMSDLAIVADANAVLDELERLLGAAPIPASGSGGEAT